MRPSYKSSEIDSAADKNQVLSGMFYQAESILGHMLSGNEIELLYSFYDWLGLPCEVIVMLLSYACLLYTSILNQFAVPVIYPFAVSAAVCTI